MVYLLKYNVIDDLLQPTPPSWVVRWGWAGSSVFGGYQNLSFSPVIGLLAKFTNLAQSLLTEPNARLQLLQHILNSNQALDGDLEKELRVHELRIITIVPTKN